MIEIIRTILGEWKGRELPEVIERSVDLADYKIFPLSFREFLQFKGVTINEETIEYSEDETAKLMAALREYLKFGGMPEVVLAGEGKKAELIHSYLSYIEDSYFIHRLPLFSFKIKNQLQYARKVYFIDTSFLNAITWLLLPGIMTPVRK